MQSVAVIFVMLLCM